MNLIDTALSFATTTASIHAHGAHILCTENDTNTSNAGTTKSYPFMRFKEHHSTQKLRKRYRAVIIKVKCGEIATSNQPANVVTQTQNTIRYTVRLTPESPNMDGQQKKQQRHDDDERERPKLDTVGGGYRLWSCAFIRK